MDASDWDCVNDINIEQYSAMEIPELLEIIGDVKGKDLLELGAGNGRITKHFIDLGAKHITTVDLTKEFVEMNRKRHGHHDHVAFRHEDATKMKMENNSLDMVFSNWLFMYLDDDECHKLMTNIMNWLRPGGRVFIRESCATIVARHEVRPVPTPEIIRGPEVYARMLTAPQTDSYMFKIVKTAPVETYIKMYQDPNQVYWLIEKVTKN